MMKHRLGLSSSFKFNKGLAATFSFISVYYLVGKIDTHKYLKATAYLTLQTDYLGAYSIKLFTIES